MATKLYEKWELDNGIVAKISAKAITFKPSPTGYKNKEGGFVFINSKPNTVEKIAKDFLQAAAMSRSMADIASVIEGGIAGDLKSNAFNPSISNTMRTRESIELQLEPMSNIDFDDAKIPNIGHVLAVELLLDIRDLLQSQDTYYRSMQAAKENGV